MSQQFLVEYPLIRPPGCDNSPARGSGRDNSPARGAGCDNSLARGADGVLRYDDLTPALTELLDLRVHAFAAREAVVEIGGPRLTYRQLWHSASRIAGGLQEHGIGYGDRVAVHMPGGVRWVQAFLGALLSGAVPVLVQDGMPERVAERVIADSSADFVLDGTGELPSGAAYIDDGAALSDLALLCYTRGSADSAEGPKGVELTNENLLSAIRSVVGVLDMSGEGLRNLVLLPLAHASGCVDQLLPTFAVGGTVVLAPDAGSLAEGLASERVDMVSGTPRIFDRLLPRLAAMGTKGPRTDGVSRVSSAEHRADPVAAAQGRARTAVNLREVFPAARQWSVWGATETSGIGLALDERCEGDSAVLGFPFGGTELALFGPHAQAGRGELLCRGPNVTRRYWNDPQRTADRFTGSWFHTGDQVTIDADGLVRRGDSG
ncbi:class I adenylate-forming enzyme family protein [Nocardia arizonensis]|uniref:class I adenylate-forming enzyme family protein n=1 Tax=Nocardia arizonensis TaxID=1141647 RepID=UPI0009E727EE|nr:AMP-binding protein [Nocardia arizonensis]